MPEYPAIAAAAFSCGLVAATKLHKPIDFFQLLTYNKPLRRSGFKESA
jgi:hypothetical protein